MATNKYLDGDGVAQVWAAVKQHVADNAVKSDGYFPALTSGAALSLTSPTAAESTWARRATDAVDGVAVVDGILGNTVVCYQLVNLVARTATSKGITYTADASGKVTLSAPSGATGAESFYTDTNNSYTPVVGHKYLAYGTKADGTVYLTHTAFGALPNIVFTANQSISGQFNVEVTAAFTGTYEFYPQLFDLTKMFGSGNEPSTVAEFERMFPEPYYPYDAGSLLPVNLTDVESVGFNQWDEEWEVGGYSSTSGNVWSTTDRIRSKAENYIPVFPSTTYYSKCSAVITYCFYDASKSFISSSTVSSNNTFTTPANAAYMRFAVFPAYGTTYNHDICINLSNSALNGTYKPYATYQRSIPVATYFPNGMRSAGTVHDELTSDAAIVRVGAVDLGTLTWDKVNTTSPHWRFYATLNSMAAGTNMICPKYETITTTQQWGGTQGIASQVSGSNALVMVSDETYSDAAAFKTAMSGVMLHYALATPTTTPIDPPLTMTYRVERGGTEAVMHTDPTAAPTWRIRYPFDLAATVMANIAPIENGIASTNYAVGSYLVHDGTLCKVTTAIAAGEAITVGTNVTATTVMAEILSLIQ